MEILSLWLVYVPGPTEGMMCKILQFCVNCLRKEVCGRGGVKHTRPQKRLRKKSIPAFLPVALAVSFTSTELSSVLSTVPFLVPTVPFPQQILKKKKKKKVLMNKYPVSRHLNYPDI